MEHVTKETRKAGQVGQAGYEKEPGMSLVIMIAYYMLCAFLAGLLFWNFVREKKSKDDLVLYLLVMVPLILRLLRIK
jgi:uncharacterized membrane protein YbjE (DUF340 family)